MKKNLFILSLSLATLSAISSVSAQEAIVPTHKDSPAAKYQSIRYEILRAIERGNEYLKSKQSPDGYWASKEFPAMSALVLTAILRDPSFDKTKEWPEYVQKGYSFLLGAQKEDGGIYSRGLASYNTSVSLLGLLAADKKEYNPAILKARNFLINQQNHFAPDNPYHGGIGYGDRNSPPTADLSNTSLALEAIYYSRQIAKDAAQGEQQELDWDAAIQFISRCQDLPETNDQAWAKEENDNKGGFAYRPSNDTPKATVKPKLEGQSAEPAKPQEAQSSSAAKEVKPEEKPAFVNGRPAGKPPGARGGRPPQSQEDEKEPLRTYGSMSYAGLQSLIYAQVTKDDPRVKAVQEWLARNFTVEENPGMGPQGLYYYYQTMSKSLSAAGIDELTLTNGKKVDWRNELAKALINRQNTDGSWVNDNNRWWEKDPVLVTSYTVLALEQLYNSIPSSDKDSGSK